MLSPSVMKILAPNEPMPALDPNCLVSLQLYRHSQDAVIDRLMQFEN